MALRSNIASLLVVIAGLLVIPASIGFWTDRVLLNESEFVALGNEILSKDPVQQHVAGEIAKDVTVAADAGIAGIDQALGAPIVRDVTNLVGSILGGVPSSVVPIPAPARGSTSAQQPDVWRDQIVKPIALDVVRTLPNSPVADEAFRATHGLLLTSIRSEVLRPEDQRIVLDLGGGVTELVKEIGIGAAPTGEAGEIVLVQGEDLSESFRIVRFVEGRAMLLAVLPLAALAIGLALAPNKGRMLTFGGLSILVASGLWVFLVLVVLKDNFVEGAIHGESARAAVEATYDVIAQSMVEQQVIFFAAGLVLLVCGVLMSALTPRAATKSPPPPRGWVS